MFSLNFNISNSMTPFKINMWDKFLCLKLRKILKWMLCQNDRENYCCGYKKKVYIVSKTEL